MENMPQGPELPQNQGDPSQQDFELFKTGRLLALIGGVLGPISLFFGGMLFDAAAIVCCAVALSKFNKISSREGQMGYLVPRMKRACIVIIVVAAIAFALNAYTAVVMYPLIEDAVTSGDFSALLGQGGQSGSSAEGGSAGSGSVWG